MNHFEKRNRQYLLSLVVIIAVTIAYAWYRSVEKTPLDVNHFQISDWKAVDRVTLTRGNQTIELRYDGTRWRVGDEPADRDMIDVLFAALQQARPARPVAKNQRDSIAYLLKGDGVQVSVYTGGQQQLQFYAGGNNRKTQAYFLKAGEEQPYVMTIPGYRVYVSGILELDRGGWKDKYAMTLNWRNFTRLTAVFPASPAASFTVQQSGTYFIVEGLAATDTTRLNDYLDAVSLLTVSSYSDDPVVTDSLKGIDPEVIITAYDVGNRSYSLALYPKAARSTGIPGIINDRQLAFFSREKLVPVLYQRTYFDVKK
jgi:hypothetical protein